jgi:hypothetical protein
MSDKEFSRFEGMVLARLSAIEERVEETLRHVREVESRCMNEHAAQASLAAELRAVREKTNLNTRVIWSAVAWIVVTAAGMVVAFFRSGK